MENILTRVNKTERVECFLTNTELSKPSQKLHEGDIFVVIALLILHG